MSARPSAELVEPEARERLIASLLRAVWSRTVLWDLAPAIIVLTVYEPGFRVLVPGTSARIRAFIILMAVPYGAACIWHARVVVRRLLRVVDRGLAGELRVEELRTFVAGLPFVAARRAGLYWLGLAVWLPLWMFAASAWTARWMVTLAMIVLVCSVEGGLLTYLTVERTLRSLKALVMRGADEPSTRKLRLSGRFLLSFAASIMLPLLVLNGVIGIGIANDTVALLPVYLLLYNMLIIGSGLVFVRLTAQSIRDPIDALRTATAKVAAGHLETEVELDDSGEIGALQLGFNNMVAGLRERERVRELFGRHVGTEVARRAMDTEPELGGELRESTAMFVDVIGSTGLAQREEPQDVVERLNAFFETVVRVVDAEGGLVNKFHGDGALCVFGAPFDQPDHAERALRAACSLHDALASVAGIEAAIGVSSGKVVAGNVGALNRYEFTVIGDPVNEAARLSDEAKLRPSRMLVSSTTMTLAGSVDGWKDAGSFQLRGRAQETRAFERP